ncbi:hypothetical protein LOK85_12250 [Xylella fastidiosa subsp. multiplex]|uniref:hypothetical protein n=1 Tax=Xylella fastidiosa TaxID=2371 RepID=UPI00234C9E10|nr:hypothetical protein [Xylella fastidiosa]MDC6416646.1 hypothetical protein [Xylella fastidiosa subsp. multiplex]
MTGIGYSSYNDPRLQPPQDDAKEYFAEQVDARVQDYLSDPEKSKKPMNGCRYVVCGPLQRDGNCLADLHDMPADQLIGSDVLARLTHWPKCKDSHAWNNCASLLSRRTRDIQTAQEAHWYHRSGIDAMQENYA